MSPTPNDVLDEGDLLKPKIKLRPIDVPVSWASSLNRAARSFDDGGFDSVAEAGELDKSSDVVGGALDVTPGKRPVIDLKLPLFEDVEEETEGGRSDEESECSWGIGMGGVDVAGGREMLDVPGEREDGFEGESSGFNFDVGSPPAGPK